MCTVFRVIALLLVFAGVSHAAELISPALYKSDAQFVECRILNTSAVTQTVRIRFFDLSGALVYDTGNISVAARTTGAISVGLSGHCRFTTAAAKTVFRATINLFEYSTISVVVAVPAT